MTSEAASCWPALGTTDQQLKLVGAERDAHRADEELLRFADCERKLIRPNVGNGAERAEHVRPGVVRRPRLFELLNRRADSAALTLITAPAGYGKTQLTRRPRT